MGLKPLQYHFFQAISRLWVCLKRDPLLLRKALHSDLALFLSGHDFCWSRQFLTQAHQAGVFPDIGRRELLSFDVAHFVNRNIKVGEVQSSISKYYQTLWEKEGQGSPYAVDTRDDSTSSFKRFQDYIYQPGVYHHLTYSGSRHLVDSLFRFRVGACGLNASLHTSTPSHRLCKLCHHGDVEDELHVIKHCPAYTHIRHKPVFSTLLRTLMEKDIRALFNISDQHLLACFISQLLHCRANLLSQAH